MKLIILLLYFLNVMHFSSANENESESNILISENEDIELFQKLFTVKRQDHKMAVQAIMGYDKYEKQYKMIDIIATKAFTVLQDCQIKLRESGYSPGMDFPQDESVKDSLSLLLENTVFLSEILLHLPEITHRIINKNKDMQLFFTWGIMFASEAPFLDSNTKKLIYLVTQELGLAEEDSNYQNPYDIETPSRNEPKSKPSKGKVKKTFKKGPRLSRNEL